MDPIKKVFNSEIRDFDDKEMTITAYVSTGAVDRSRESLDPEGVDLSHYRKNPVVLWAHDYSMPPIGKAVWAKKTEGGILSKVKFYSSDKAVGEFAQEIYNMYKEKFLNAFSVGFIPKETEWAKEEDRDNPKKPRLTYKKWEMLEYSAVPVPANPEALQMAFQKGIIKSPIWKTLVNKEESAEPLVQEFNNEIKEEKAVTSGEAKTEIKENPLDELIAENKILNEKIISLEKENVDLKFKVFELLNEKQKSLSEITAESVVQKMEDVIRGAIRKAQGKID